MANLRVKLIVFGILGALIGTAVAFVLISIKNQIGLGYHLDTTDTYLKAQAFFSAKGAYASIYFKLIFGTVFGAMLFMVLAVYLLDRKGLKNLKQMYQDIDLNSRYLVRQRSKETLLIGIGFLVCVAVILFAFRWLHFNISHDLTGSSRNPLPGLTLALVWLVSLACTYGGMLAVIAVLRYGKYSKLPIEIRNNSIFFFQNFYGLPIFALDRPVEVSLENAEIDFDSQSSKGSLYVSDFEDRIAISPKLEFINGSFDELADYLEKFAVEEEEENN